MEVFLEVFFTKMVVDFWRLMALWAFNIHLFFLGKQVDDGLIFTYDSFVDNLFSNTHIATFMIIPKKINGQRPLQKWQIRTGFKKSILTSNF